MMLPATGAVSWACASPRPGPAGCASASCRRCAAAASASRFCRAAAAASARARSSAARRSASSCASAARRFSARAASAAARRDASAASSSASWRLRAGLAELGVERRRLARLLAFGGGEGGQFRLGCLPPPRRLGLPGAQRRGVGRQLAADRAQHQQAAHRILGRQRHRQQRLGGVQRQTLHHRQHRRQFFGAPLELRLRLALALRQLGDLVGGRRGGGFQAAQPGRRGDPLGGEALLLGLGGAHAGFGFLERLGGGDGWWLGLRRAASK